ncbi:MAG: NAD-dependent epimerase/dehydratase family protein [Actinomycetota bacterium]
MALHTIIGAGAVGSGTALLLANAGHDVITVTRSGSGPDHANITNVAADATDAEQLATIARGSESIYNCANPPAYHRWAEQWPPLATAILTAAEATGARLVTMGNLYGYAPGSSPMCATDPLDPPTPNGEVRVTMWQQALAAHEAGRVSVTEVRASDYVGPGLGDSSHLGDRFVPRILAGRSVPVFGDPDMPHSWSYIGDVCRTVATVGLDDRADGRAWHVPTLAPMSAQAMADAFADAAGVDRIKVTRLPRTMLRIGSIFVPLLRALLPMSYQFDEPFEIDAADTTDTFQLTPTPLDDQLRATLAGYGATDLADR